MDEAETPPPVQDGAEAEPAPGRRRSGRGRKLARGVALGIIGLVVLVIVALASLNTQIGKRFIAEQIAQQKISKTVSVSIGNIRGDIYGLFGPARLEDVVLSDENGEFMRIESARLNWKPYNYFFNGVDIDALTVNGAVLKRLPTLGKSSQEPGGLAVHVRHLDVNDLILAKGLVSPDKAYRVDLTGSLELLPRRTVVKATGSSSGGDRFAVDFDSRKQDNVYKVALDYRASATGLMAGLTGAKVPYRVRITGDGAWDAWNGQLGLVRAGETIGGFALTKRGDLYLLNGRLDASGMVSGLPERALGDQVLVTAAGRLVEDTTAAGIAFDLRGRGLDLRGQGGIDYFNRAVRKMRLEGDVRDPALFGSGVAIRGGRFEGVADGSLDNLAVKHTLAVDRMEIGTATLTSLTQRGTARWTGKRLILPLDAAIGRIETGNAFVDPRLISGRLMGDLVLDGNRLSSRQLRLAFPGASAQLAFDGNLATNTYRLRGPAAVNGLPFETVGIVNAAATIDFTLPDNGNWTLDANFRGQVPRVTNDTIANLAGPQLSFGGGVSLSAAGPVTFRQVRLDSQKLNLVLDGTVRGRRTTVAGRGRSADYGPFTIEAALTDAGPTATLVFADPLPAAGLKDVRVALAPTKEGFTIDTQGGSLLGDFEGTLGLVMPSGEPARIDIQTFRLSQTQVSGGLTLGDGGVAGTITLAGGGLDGTIDLAPRNGAQGFAAKITARNAALGPSYIARADIDASGTLGGSNTDLEGSVYARGVRLGTLFLGQVAARAQVSNGIGQVTGSVAGARGSRFALQFDAQFGGDRIALIARGSYAGQAITMPRRAILTRQPEGGYTLAPTQITYGDGAVVASGRLGGGDTQLSLALEDMPLSLIDVAVADLGLGGNLSGTIDYRAQAGGPPTADVKVKVQGLTRAGLVLTSRPINLALVSRLTADRLEARAVIDDAQSQSGRLQLRIANLPRDGTLPERLRAGELFAQLRYRGAASALWRLAAVDAFDFTGPVSLAADATGTLAQPEVRGSLASDDLRVQSALSGTDVRNAKVEGTFRGSRLQINRFSGTAVNGGRVSGSGVVDLANLGAGVGPELDLRIAASNARLFDANGLTATVTGPIRIVSNGIGGTIAGRLLVNRASWKLGTAAEDYRLPQIETKEVNVPSDRAPARRARVPWNYLIDARAPGRVDVDGLGLDSEWSGNLRVRGTTDEPRLGGSARYVSGGYSFAGTRFELTKGQIRFDESGPIDPQVDIAAETTQNGLSVTVTATGSATQPEITFTSTPSLPEEEILARLLFGGSITSLSATDALQLGSALASLRGGGGMDPINQLRTAIGLDRLRIVSADPTIDRGTGVALGKNIGRRFYVELITDGRGYTATSVEFRITRWLSILATISSIGRNSVAAEASYDY
ncbi:translocation/assembly module TamB domain-containing protein [Erythrobacter sp. LQ02-29]|uniref:translocation/assembly module TamB domain-containing protein n=1 Tax=Erythrobacter sp. LQ02-29 TaxID=2920384 RepID=UPI001F4DAD55|nr:translocation/assembly module TamB domain-containing protein [Erythrobacter sp. LQ02-29]MCP9222503.1 translocation/assembly module TamB domain-containing protein [Erythrobacter sp. LQ02-29]